MPDTKPTNRERVKEIVAGIEDGIQKLFQSEKFADYLRTMSRFHSYSVNNTILIHMQMPNATKVAGFQKWKKQFGRHVKRGETGITILAPTPYKKKIEAEKLDPDTKLPMLDADGNTIMEEKIIEIPMFKPVKVFDVSQTEGKPLPNLAADLTGNVQYYEAFMEALRRTSPVPIEIKSIPANLDGYFSMDAQKIVVQAGMSEVQTVCATVHEIGHSILHNREKAQAEAAAGEGEAPTPKDKNTREVEAESVSYAVCQYYGIETGENSFGYIASWSEDRSLPELRASLDTITKAANTIISGVDKHFEEICKERGIDLLDREENVLESADRASSLDATDTTDTPERFALDYCDFMEKLHEAGIVQGSFTEPKETLAGKYATEVLRHGHFEGVREELTKYSRMMNLPTAVSLLERLEKLSDAWDATLTCMQRSYLMDDGTGPRSYILAYNKDTPSKDKEVVFLGPTPLCNKLMAELRDGTTTLREMRQLNRQQNSLTDRADVLIYENMEDQSALFQVGNSHYLHVQTSENMTIDYTLYYVDTMRLIDGGQFGIEGLGAFGTDPIEAAYSSILSSHSIAPVNVKPLPVEMLEEIEAANELPEPEPPVSHTADLIEHFSQEDAYLLDTTLDQYPMPDETVDEDALINAGYIGDDLFPLGENRACELLEQDSTVYMLHPGGEPEMVLDSDEIREQTNDTVFAIPREEWEQSALFRNAIAERMNRQEEREAAFLGHGGDCFAIYQVKLDNDERRHYIRYQQFDRLKEAPKKSDYELAYTAPLPEGTTLDNLFEQFNIRHPADYQRPSMSVSDIVALNRGGVVTYHYCDSIGFRELPDFNKPDNHLRTAELSTEDDANMIDGIINNGSKQPTVAELEAQVKAGQTISILDLWNAVEAENKNKPKVRKKRPSVLAKLKAPLPKQPQKEQKTAPKKSARKER